MNKLEITNRIERQGLRLAADAYREEVRLRLVAAAAGQKKDRPAIVAQAWEEMWAKFGPIVERREQEKRDAEAAAELVQQAKAAKTQPEPPAPQLAGLPPITKGLLDPEYLERDPGKQLRDGWLWVVMEWMMVIEDTDEGPVVDLAAASTPPPTPFALFVLSTYALGNIDKRRELITRALKFAFKSYDDVSDGDPAETAEAGFLEEIS